VLILKGGLKLSSKSKHSSDDPIFQELRRLKGTDILLVTQADQLNLLGQTFRPIFCGPIVEVENGHITIFPVTIKLINAPFYKFPTPLSFPIEKIAQYSPDFDCNTIFPLT
jgi:hypothetical protein